jgi:subfamily B ATP-binding cassette protein MsbA
LKLYQNKKIKHIFDKMAKKSNGWIYLKEIIKRFWPYIKEYKFYYILVVFGGILIIISTAASAHIMKPLMDDMFIAKKKEMLYLIPLGLIGIYVTKAIGKYIQTVFMEYIGQSIVTRFRAILLTDVTIN